MKYNICSHCIMDTSDREIQFDENGVCNHCKAAKIALKKNQDEKKNFNNMIHSIKEAGKYKKYDCIIGVSGGVDSSYVAYYVKQLGLRPLAVHLDNGWDSELAVQNVRNILEKLNIDLITYVLDWQGFRDLQLAFFKSSTPDLEIPTDHAIRSILLFAAHKYNISYIIDGYNITSESILPRTWSYGHSDWRYIKNIYSQLGNHVLKNYPHTNDLDYIYFYKMGKIRHFSILNYMDYDKEKAKQFLIDELGWRDYGGKHHESFYTKFYQQYILPVKFGIDKRRMHLSSLICSGQITRQDALSLIETPCYKDKQEEQLDIEYFCKKIEISMDEFNNLINQKPKAFTDYKNRENSFYGRLYQALRK